MKTVRPGLEIYPFTLFGEVGTEHGAHSIRKIRLPADQVAYGRAWEGEGGQAGHSPMLTRHTDPVFVRMCYIEACAVKGLRGMR